ncbi:MAG TPA: hypothetical protein VIL86_07185 [Tepidisphaeraceae bacterium]|jgi:hypothetical protein
MARNKQVDNGGVATTDSPAMEAAEISESNTASAPRKLADVPALRAAYAKLDELFKRQAQLQVELRQTPKAESATTTAAQMLLDGQAVTAPELGLNQRLRNELAVVSEAIRLQQSRIDALKKSSCQQVRTARTPERQALIERLSIALQNTAGAIRNLAAFDSELEQDDVSPVGYPFRQANFNGTMPMSLEFIDIIDAWEREYQADQFLEK